MKKKRNVTKNLKLNVLNVKPKEKNVKNKKKKIVSLR